MLFSYFPWKLADKTCKYSLETQSPRYGVGSSPHQFHSVQKGYFCIQLRCVRGSVLPVLISPQTVSPQSSQLATETWPREGENTAACWARLSTAAFLKSSDGLVENVWQSCHLLVECGKAWVLLHSHLFYYFFFFYLCHGGNVFMGVCLFIYACVINNLLNVEGVGVIFSWFYSMSV